MNIIFLDVDGVLNSIEYRVERYQELGRALRQEESIDNNCLECLKEIVTSTNSKIVVTSVWKLNDTDMKILSCKLKEYGMDIYDVTSYIPDYRGKEIKEWLSQHHNTINYIILDDDKFKDYDELEEHVIYTSMYNGRGLNKSHVEKAIKLLKNI